MRKFVKILTSKTLLSLIFILGQLIFIYFLFAKLLEDKYVGVYLHTLFVILAFFIVLHISSSNINPVYKIAWLIPIVAFPVFGAFFYLFYHQNNVRTSKVNKYNKIIENRQQLLKEIPNELNFKEIKYLNNNGWRYYKNTETTFIDSGQLKLEMLIADLKKAEKFIFLEYFIISKSIMLNEIIEVLKAKANEGVLVYLIYDDFGSANNLPFNFRKKMLKANINVVAFNPMRLHINFAMNYRTHRKIVVIDNKIAYTGGINIGDEYTNTVKRFGNWVDFAIKFEGRAVRSLTLTFLENWNFSSKIKLDPNNFLEEHLVKNDSYVAPFADNPIEDKQIARSMFLYLINEARESILITSPYLILDNEIQTALKLAAKSGVKVQIAIPGIPDKRLVYLVTEAYALDLLNDGIEIYKYMDGFVHSKLFVVDNNKALVGTSNLDFRSLYLNFENNIYLYNSQTVNDVSLYIKNIIDNSTKQTKKALTKRFFLVKTLQSILKGFSPLL